MEVKSEEKRRFPRLRLKTMIRYQLRGMQDFSNTLSDDISAGGVSFVNNDFIAPATTLALEINLLSRILHPFGKIVWSNPIPHSDRYRMGIRFVELDHEEQVFLDDYIKMHLQTRTGEN